MLFENKVKRKILNWKNKNIELLEALEKTNLVEFKKAMKFDGAFVELSEYLSQEEINISDEFFYEKIIEEVEDFYIEKFESFFKEIKDSIFLENIFRLIIKRSKRLNLFFIKGYFAFTENIKNITNRLNYIMKYCNEVNFSIVLMGSMLNKNEKIYLEVLKYAQKHNIDYKPSVVLSSRVIWGNVFYNYKSWENFYIKHMDVLREERKQKNKKIDSLSSVIYFFVFYQHNGLCNKQLKIDSLVKIYNFIIENYKVRYKFKHREFVLIHLYNQKLKELNHTMKVLQNKIKNNKRSQFRSLMLSTKQKQIEEFLINEVSRVTQSINHEECLKFFKKIKICPNNYKTLEEYIELNKKIQHNKKIFKDKKLNKV